MARYIDADALYEKVGALDLYGTDNRNRLVTWHPEQNSIPYVLITDVLNAVYSQPTADVVERKKGEWLDIMVGEMPAQACNKCKTFYPLAYTGGGHNFCPNCGARMTKE